MSWAVYDARCEGVIQLRAGLAKADADTLATHYKRSIAQRARWALEEWKKERGRLESAT